MLENLGVNLLTVSFYTMFVGLSLWIIQLTGKLMNYISDEHKDKEWVNTLLVIIDIILITIILVLIGNMIIIMLPYILIFLVVMMVISIFGILYILVSEKIKGYKK